MNTGWLIPAAKRVTFLKTDRKLQILSYGGGWKLDHGYCPGFNWTSTTAERCNTFNVQFLMCLFELNDNNNGLCFSTADILLHDRTCFHLSEPSLHTRAYFCALGWKSCKLTLEKHLKLTSFYVTKTTYMYVIQLKTLLLLTDIYYKLKFHSYSMAQARWILHFP